MAQTTFSPAPANLLLSDEVAWYLNDRGIPLPTCPPKIKTQEPGNVPGARFDPERVDRVLRVFGALRHTQGKWANKPLLPDPWQIAYILAPVFGWVAKNDDGDYVRIIRRLYVDIPRKNGKTTTAGGIATYLLAADREAGAQVYAVAAAKDQARFCFDPVKQMAQRSPALKPYVRALQSRVVHEPSGSYFAAVSSVADLMHGANIHAAIVDELHVHKTPEIVEAVETGTGSRTQPLIVIITTADDGRSETIYARRRTYVEQVAAGVLKDTTIYGVIWAADETDDPFVPETWQKANPGYGISPSREYLEQAANEAKQSPAFLANFQRLHLGLRTKQDARFLQLDQWDRNASIVNEADLAGRECYGGLDLASTSDLCALAWDFPDGKGGHDVIWRLWAPEGAFDALNRRTAGGAGAWVRQGRLFLSPGDVTDYDYIRAAINTDRERFAVREIAFDPWNSTQLVNDLMADGAPMVQMRQGFASIAGPTRDFGRLLGEGTAERPLYRHGGNPAVRWQVDNFAVETDPAGNVKPSKKKAGDKIDAVVAAIMALSRALQRQPARVSAYESNEVQFL